MTNFQLLVIAVISVAAAVWWSVTRTSAAWAPTVLAIVMFVMAFGGPIWEWSKWSGGAGLIPAVKAAPFGESMAVQAFLWASIGAGLSALLIGQAPASLRQNRNSVVSKNVSIVVVAAAAISFVGFAIGQGSAFVGVSDYGDMYCSDCGNPFLLRMFYPTGCVIGLIAMALLAVEKDRKLRFCMIGIAMLWFIGSAATGSRTAVAFPVVAAALVINHEISQRRLHPLMIVATLLLFATSVFTFSATLEARSMSSGILYLPDIVDATISDSVSSTDSLLHPLKQFASSVFVSFPDAEYSVTSGVELDVLIANANVLPGTAQPAELERYWPYEWVPLSFVGTWFGATSWVGQFLLFGAIGWMLGYTAYNIQRSRYQLLSFVPVYFAVLIGVLSAQYWSRMVWRIVSIGLFLLIASYLARRSRGKEMAEESLHNKHLLNTEGIVKKNNASMAPL